MNIEKHGNTYRVKKMYKGTLYRVSFDHKPTEREITLAMAEVMKEDKPKEKGTFESFARRYVDSKDKILSPASIRTYNMLIDRLSDGLKATNIYDITQEQIQKEINNYSIDHAPKTVRALHGFISSVLNMYRPQMTLKTALPRLQKEKGYQPTTEDIKRVLEAVRGSEYSVPFQLGILGLRRGEICALTLDDLKGNELTINKTVVYNKGWMIKQAAKTDESNRVIYVPDKLADEIKTKGVIYDGDPKRLNKHLQRIQTQLDIPTFRFHDLRHYFASYASTLGIPEADIMAMGGWKSDHVFKSIYRDSMNESRKQSMQTIGNCIL